MLPVTLTSRADSPSLTGAALLPPSPLSVPLASEQEVPKGDSQEAVPFLPSPCFHAQVNLLTPSLPRGMSPLGMVPHPPREAARALAVPTTVLHLQFS